MSDGKVHAGVSIGTAAGILSGYGLSYLTNDPISILIVSAGTLMGVFVGPDLDVDEGNISNYYIKKLFYINSWWRVFWRPYRIGFRHRGFFSHSPILSTILRILYIFFPLFVMLFKDQDTSWFQIAVYSLITQAMSIPLIFLVWFYWSYVDAYGLQFILGLIISDILHLTFD